MYYRVSVHLYDEESDTNGSVVRTVEAASAVAARFILSNNIKKAAADIGVLITNVTSRLLTMEEIQRHKLRSPDVNLSSFESLFDNEDKRNKRKKTSSDDKPEEES